MIAGAPVQLKVYVDENSSLQEPTVKADFARTPEWTQAQCALF